MTNQPHFSKGKFTSYNQVRMHDTDMAGILYFARQFRFAHDALEDMFESEGYSIFEFFDSHKIVLVIAHAEADYFAPLKVGDKLQVYLSIQRMGNSSIAFFYEIFKGGTDLVGTVKTVHVALDAATRQKIQVPDFVREKLGKYLVPAL